MTTEKAHAGNDRRLMQALIALVVVAALISFNIWYTAYQVKESDHRWCELIPSLDDRYQALKNPAPEAVEFRDQIHRLRAGLPC